MNTFSHVPPGFRFHPTDEELVDYYLRKKINSRRIDLDVIRDVDLYKIEPWDLQELCRLGTEEQNEWYFFSHKDKKYPTGTRTNRATAAGFWKATGRDKAIYSKHDLVGMRKTLVFYKGRAPNGQKSDWIMHEYRLETNENATTTQEEGWVVCRVFKKRIATTMRKVGEHESPIWYDDHQVSFMPEIDSQTPNINSHSSNVPHSYQNYNPYMITPCKRELDLQNYQIHPDHFLQLPLLESPKLLPNCNSPMPIYGNIHATSERSGSFEHGHQDHNFNLDQVTGTTDWRVLDKFVASQLISQGEVAKESDDHYSGAKNSNDIFHSNIDHRSNNIALGSKQGEMEPDNDASISISGCQIELWK